MLAPSIPESLTHYWILLSNLSLFISTDFAARFLASRRNEFFFPLSEKTATSTARIGAVWDLLSRKRERERKERSVTSLESRKERRSSLKIPSASAGKDPLFSKRARERGAGPSLLITDRAQPPWWLVKTRIRRKVGHRRAVPYSHYHNFRSCTIGIIGFGRKPR